MTGCEFTPYLPFVLVSVISTMVAGRRGRAGVGGDHGRAFRGSHPHDLGCFMSAAGIFLASSAMLIGIAVSIRHLISALRNRGADESAGGIVFSLEKGEV